MASKLKKFIFTSLALLIVYNFWKAFSPEVEISEDVEPKIEAESVLSEEVLPKPKKLEKTIIEKSPKEKPEDRVANAYQIYRKQFLPLAQDRDIQCNKEAEVLFKEPNFIDIEDPFYQRPVNVVDELHKVYNKTLLRPEVGDAYGSLASVLKNDLFKDTTLTPSEYRNQMGLLEYYCRPEMSLRFIETVMEANKRYKFSPKMRRDIFTMSMNMLDSSIGEMYTTNNLIYGLGLFKLMIDNEMLPKEVGEEIVPLFDKILDNHKTFSRSWQRDKESRDKTLLWTLLKEDHERRAEFGRDFKEFMNRMRTRYYIR